jgi:hypothetical protein
MSRAPARLTALAFSAALSVTSAAAPDAAAAARPSARPGPGSPPVTPLLPAPTGRQGVGVVELHLVDAGRPDPWHPDRAREVMVSVWYPAERGPGGHRGAPAPWLSPGVVPSVEAQAVPAGIPLGALDWGGVRTHARVGAPVAAGVGDHPVVLYSPGLGSLRAFGTVLVEELASRGYVVVTIDHTHETVVELPGGRVVPAVDLPRSAADLQVAIDARVADVRLVLDRLELLDRGHARDAGGRGLPDGLAGHLDLGRVGAFGHSFGGFTAGETMVGDRRLAAGANLDGTMAAASGLGDEPYAPSRVAAQGLDRPFLLMGSEVVDPDTGATVRHDHLGFDRSWRDFWSRGRGWRRDLTLATAAHNSYTDLQAVVPAAPGVPDEARRGRVGTIDPARSIAAQRAYVTGFFDLHLRGDRDAHRLFTGPTPRHPEVVFAG